MTPGFFAHLIVSAALLLLVANAVSGVEMRGAVSAILAALMLGLVNAVVRPLAIVLTLPLTVVTFGLFLLILNGVMLKLAAALVPGFRIRGIMPAVWQPAADAAESPDRRLHGAGVVAAETGPGKARSARSEAKPSEGRVPRQSRGSAKPGTRKREASRRVLASEHSSENTSRFPTPLPPLFETP